MTAVQSERFAASVASVLADAALMTDPTVADGDAVDAFLAARDAAREAAERVSLTDAGGWVFDGEAERLAGEVEDAAELLIAGWWTSCLTVPEDVLAAAREYTGRRRRVVQAPVAMDWDALDWGRSGRAA